MVFLVLGYLGVKAWYRELNLYLLIYYREKISSGFRKPWSKEQDSQDTLLLFTLFFTGERWYPLVPGNPGVRSKNHRKLFTLLYNGERWYFQVLVHPGVENRIYRILFTLSYTEDKWYLQVLGYPGVKSRIYRILFTLSYTGERWYLQVPRNPGVRSKVSGWRSNLYPQQELIQPVFHWLKQNFKYLFMNRKYELDKLLGNLWRWNRFNGSN